jgi:spore germination protein KB
MYIHHLTDYLQPETPFLVITVMHVLVITYFVWLGLEVIARFGVIAFSLALVFTLLVFLATLPEINFNRILPLFEAGLMNNALASFKVNSFVGHNLIIIAMLLPMVKEQKKAARSATLGVVIGGLIFIFYFIAELMVMGPQLVSLLRIASMDFVRSIQITQYLHRFESFMVGLWYWSILVQGGILTYCAHLAFRQTIGIKRQNIWLVVLSGIIMVFLTYLMAHNRVTFLNFKEYSWHYWALPVQYGVPLLLLLVSFFRKPAAAGK